MSGRANVDVDLSALQAFRSRVDELLAELDANVESDQVDALWKIQSRTAAVAG